ncbi:MAG: Gp15 family bacteriophage protein, partial [Ruminococcus sp.]
MLINTVPESLTIAGTEFEINTDFRVWLKFEMFLSDEVEDSKATLLDIKKLIFKSKIPPDRADEETTEQILWFYRCGKPEQKGGKSSKKIFDYDYDDGYICAAFMEQYHIDLNKANLHWWKFHALMLSLSENTEFVKIM